MPEHYPGRYIVVGVTAKQPSAVLREAARFARQFNASLMCAHVDAGSYVVTEHADGSVEGRPIDPDVLDWNSVVFDPVLADRIRSLAREEDVTVEFRALAGDVGHALSRLADVVDTQMIIVGSRRGGLRTGMHEFFAGSVAVHLAHRQRRPVVVIPLSPVAEHDRLPWEGTRP